MVELESVRVICECLEDFNSHDPERAERLYAENVEHDVPALRATWRGRAEHQAAYRKIVAASSDIRMQVTAVFGEGDQALVEWVMTGTSEWPLGDLPATGRRFEVRGATFARIRGSQVQHQVDYWDMTTLLRQIGLLAPEVTR